MPSKIVARTTSSPPAGSGVTVKGSRLTNVEVDENFTSLYTHKLEASNNLSDLTNPATARTNLVLGNVENKSSATIRSELTSLNVTTALGYTPPTPTGTGASGTWGISISGNAATATNSTNLGGFPRRVDLSDYTTWDGTRVGPVGWYGFAGGPGGGSYHFGFRTAMFDTGYGAELAFHYTDDKAYFRRFTYPNYGAWNRLAHWKTRIDWNSGGLQTMVAGCLGWRAGDGYSIFDASSTTNPDGGAISSNTNPDGAWVATYPTLMGWNGSNTYGVRVDAARYAERSFGSSFKVNTDSDSGTLFGSSSSYALRVNGSAFLDAVYAKGSASEFHRNVTGFGTISSFQSAMQLGLNSTDNGHQITSGGPSLLFFGFDRSSPPAKVFVGRISGNFENNTVGSVSGGVAVSVRENNADSGASTLAATWFASKNFRQEGFSQLGGSGAPAIKMKKLTGTTNSAENGGTNIAHGLTAGKIISAVVMVAPATNQWVLPRHTYYPGYEFDVYIDSTNVTVLNHATNSESILSKSIVVLLTYEE